MGLAGLILAMRTPRIVAFCVLTLMTMAAARRPVFVQSPGEQVAIVEGVTFVLAVSNAIPPASGSADVLQGDYEMVVALLAVGAGGVTHAASFDGSDAKGVKRQGIVQRVVPAADLQSAGLQIFGFHMDDPARIPGTTALGPSLAVTRELVRAGTVAYSFRNFLSGDVVSGTLRRSSAATIKFPVLINGKRVELDAVHATGQMAAGANRRPFETVILDHPQYPISLRIAYGPRDGGFPFRPDFVREVVRIDLPTGRTAIAAALEKDCRVELSGIYFDFNQATIKPQSAPTLREIATALKVRPQGRINIEGHTDDIGSDSYNDDLSARRAAAVKDALVRDFAIDAARLATIGYGERRPIEANTTLAGRARNRRVELACAAK